VNPTARNESFTCQIDHLPIQNIRLNRQPTVRVKGLTRLR